MGLGLGLGLGLTLTFAMVGGALGSCRLARLYGGASGPPASAATRFCAHTPMARVVTQAAGAPAC